MPHEKILSTGWGNGGNEIAEYLRGRHGDQVTNLTVYANYDGFWEFFPGESIWFSRDPFENNADYLVFFGGYHNSFQEEYYDYSDRFSNKTSTPSTKTTFMFD